jgi:hypothetical protein
MMGATIGENIFNHWRDAMDEGDADDSGDERALQDRMESEGARQIGAALYIEASH